jgi:hypothetical protein
MNETVIVLQGIVKPDGTLEVPAKVTLPPGPVEVLLKPVSASGPQGSDWWTVLQQIRADREARGYRFLNDAEVTALVEELRSEDDRLDRIHEQNNQGGSAR